MTGAGSHLLLVALQYPPQQSGLEAQAETLPVAMQHLPVWHANPCAELQQPGGLGVCGQAAPNAKLQLGVTSHVPVPVLQYPEQQPVPEAQLPFPVLIQQWPLLADEHSRLAGSQQAGAGFSGMVHEFPNTRLQLKGSHTPVPALQFEPLQHGR